MVKTLCDRCRGCGQIDSTKFGKPWLDWLHLLLTTAVVSGFVHPLPCPACYGAGYATEGETPSIRQALAQLEQELYMHRYGASISQAMITLRAAIEKELGTESAGCSRHC